MSLPTNSFRAKRYFRSKFKEGKYLLANEATDLQLETHDLIREFMKFSYGSFASGDGWKPAQTAADKVALRPGSAWDSGIPYLLKSGSDAKVVAGVLPTGLVLTDLSATTVDVGGKLLDASGALPNATYAIVLEATEELVKPSGTGAVDPYLEGVNVGEETENKLRLIYKIHVVLNSDLTETPTYPLSVTNHFVNKITVTPQNSVANFVISSVPITQDINGADLRLTLDNANGNLPFSTAAQDFINGVFIDSDGNEMTITSITTEDAGATVKILLDREVEYNSSSPKSGIPVITNLVPYQLVKRDYYVSSNAGNPLGRHFYKIATFIGSGGNITSLTDLRVVNEPSSFASDLNARLVGGGSITFTDSNDNLVFGANLRVTLPKVNDCIILATTVNIPTDGQVAYVVLNRSATVDYNRTLTVVDKNSLPINVDYYVVMERKDNRIHFPHNGSVGDNETGNLGSFGTTPGFANHDHDGSGGESPDLVPDSVTLPTINDLIFGAKTLNAYLVPLGAIIPHYDFNGALTFDTAIWKYCDGSSATITGIGSQTLPDLSNRYLVGFGTEGGGDIDSAVWSATPVGNASHQIALNHTHTGPSHTHTTNNHFHNLSSLGYAKWHHEEAVDTFYWDRRTGISFTSDQRMNSSGGQNSHSTTVDTGIALGGTTDGENPSTNAAGTGATGSALSAIQSIQPRSVRVRFIMRVA